MPKPEIRRGGSRASSADQVILEMLAAKDAHLTSKEVYAAVRRRLPAVNTSTVYRSLERLAKAGLVSISDMGSGAAVYCFVAAEPHHHIVCQDCGEVITLGHAEVQAFFSGLQHRHGFKIATNHLVLFGQCPACLAVS